MATTNTGQEELVLSFLFDTDEWVLGNTAGFRNVGSTIDRVKLISAVQSGSTSLPYGVTDITTGHGRSTAGRKTLAMRRTPSRMRTSTSWSKITSLSIRIDFIESVSSLDAVSKETSSRPATGRCRGTRPRTHSTPSWLDAEWAECTSFATCDRDPPLALLRASCGSTRPVPV